jgi:folate-dependent phosphoribosylglycinamide formyltransferase PurN
MSASYNGDRQAQRIVLMTTDCAQVGSAVTELIERHGDCIAAVITSDMTRPSRGSTVQQAVRNWKRSGPAFLGYLVTSFMLYFAWIRLDAARARITGAPRRRMNVSELCRSHGIPHLETDDVNGRQAVRMLTDAAPDFIVVYWFDQILRPRVISIPTRAVVNFHAARLPQCRGLFPTFFSALRNDDRFGVTAHLIEDTEIDAGPILAQVEVTAPRGHSVLYYDGYVNRAGVPLVEKVLAEFDQLTRVVPSEGSYYSYPTRDEVAEARGRGLPLVRLDDFFTVSRHYESPSRGARRAVRTSLGQTPALAPTRARATAGRRASQPLR